MSGKNPWRDEMTPEEFEEYYDRKLERIEELSGECQADGCDEWAEWPREYCSSDCWNQAIRAAAQRLDKLMNR